MGADVIIKKLVVGPIQANCYILGCRKTREAAVIDPGDEADRILLALAKDRLTLKAIINTHGHFDHVGGNKALKDATSAPIIIHPADAPMLPELNGFAQMFGMRVENSPPPDRTVKEGDTIEIGEIILKVIHTPGHSPGGISLYTEGMVFAGDTLFAGSIGRTDFPGGDYGLLIKMIQTKLFALPDDTVVYAGHNQETKIGVEKKYNPFAGLH